jgi:Cys-rich protein (TIGR01571 family)
MTTGRRLAGLMHKLEVHQVTEDIPEGSYEEREGILEILSSRTEDAPSLCSEIRNTPGEGYEVDEMIGVQASKTKEGGDGEELEEQHGLSDGMLDVLSFETNNAPDEEDLAKVLRTETEAVCDEGGTKIDGLLIKGHAEFGIKHSIEEKESALIVQRTGANVTCKREFSETLTEGEGGNQFIENTNESKAQTQIKRNLDIGTPHKEKVEFLDKNSKEMTPHEEGPMLESSIGRNPEATEARLTEQMDKAKAAAEELARRMHDAAGSFFADLRSAVDAQVTNLQGNLNSQVPTNHENLNSFLMGEKSAGQTRHLLVEKAADASAVSASYQVVTGSLVTDHETLNSHILQKETVGQLQKPPTETLTADSQFVDASHRTVTGSLLAVGASYQVVRGSLVTDHETLNSVLLQKETVGQLQKPPTETLTADSQFVDASHRTVTGSLFGGLVARFKPPVAEAASSYTEHNLSSDKQVREQAHEQQPINPFVPVRHGVAPHEQFKMGSEVELANVGTHGNDKNARETQLPPFLKETQLPPFLKETQLPTFDVAKYDNMDVTDIVAKQQLLGELKEAYNLMRLSVTPETTRFWRDHVLTLQARLDDLHVERSAVQETDIANHLDRYAHRYEFPSQEQCATTDLSEKEEQQQQCATTDLSEKEEQQQQCTAFEASALQEREQPAAPLSLSMSQPSEQHGSRSQGFTQQPPAESEQPPYDVPMVDVVAPADLPGGYHFEAEIEGYRFLATVPPGGVQQGETFTCFMRELNSVAIDIPVGYWKDGLFNMCELGVCHPVNWNSIFCPLIILGQVQTRINLDFLGRPKFGDQSTSNRVMMLTVVLFWTLINVGLFAACNLKWSRGMELSGADVCAFGLINVAMFGFIVFVTQSTRSSLREKFMIREERCLDLEDICCAALCLPCAVSQMARHSANYDDYEAVCCSKTGLPNGVRVNQDPTKEPDGYVV